MIHRIIEGVFAVFGLVSEFVTVPFHSALKSII